MSLVDIRKKLNSNSGASLLYAIMLFMIATLISILIISSSVTALKRSRAKVESKQSALMLNSAASLLQDYMCSSGETGDKSGLSYVKTVTEVKQKTEQFKNNESKPETYSDPTYTYKRDLKVTKKDQSYSSDKYDSALVSCDVNNSSELTGNITYIAPANADLFLPEMIQKGILKGLLFVDQGAGEALNLKYESEKNKNDNGVIYMRLPYDSGAGKNTALNQAKAVKVTYIILPKTSDSQIIDASQTTTDYEIVFTLTLADIEKSSNAGSTTYKDTEYKAYLVMPISSIKEETASSSSSVISTETNSESGWTTRISEVKTTTTNTVTWQAGKICTTDPLAEKQKTE